MFLAVAAPGFASLGNRLNVMRTGAPPLDVCFADPGPVGQAIRYGIGIHKGEHWGRANQLARLAFCHGTIRLAVGAGTMWWKRRPADRLGIPP